METKVENIAKNYIQLIPLFYGKLTTLQKAAPKTEHDLTHLQFHILEAVFHAVDGISMTQLAQNIGISKQQLTPLVNKLEEAEYVKRVSDTNDKRVVNLFLTEKGRKMASLRWEEFYHTLCKRFDELNEDDLLDLEYALTKINRILSKLE
ncbi:MarR family winged helix-turn-helix transcriptional regulator [Neobacillus ginsengisoli]|uniref:DNA-binding MarR family transcriptional regulator n=1 Tax=Neobacillus ginsengisoli TaxID=904295 RepID=A0ABT9Y153_9BACI|nr:MarR family transcriptional regulator [Neobacillus ginsengisoli]MDQ0201548.1 DNA-binding MarR family transcriptional regulator [Neobacillus ginsengisoli]